jgi:hypothetical protein
VLRPEQEKSRGGAVTDNLGKIPLALQQLALAREREISNNNNQLAAEISQAMTDLTKRLIEVSAGS